MPTLLASPDLQLDLIKHVPVKGIHPLSKAAPARSLSTCSRMKPFWVKIRSHPKALPEIALECSDL